ncbi:MAG: hypothetical protein EBX99_09850, partial [Acidimicrobiia bacterium]|nr:hypothetical protein [Acidimicrobiia bacterium]
MVLVGALVAPIVWASRGDRTPVTVQDTGGAAAIVEFDAATEHPVVALITEWQNHDGQIERRDENSDLGG